MSRNFETSMYGCFFRILCYEIRKMVTIFFFSKVFWFIFVLHVCIWFSLYKVKIERPSLSRMVVYMWTFQSSECTKKSEVTQEKKMEHWKKHTHIVRTEGNFGLEIDSLLNKYWYFEDGNNWIYIAGTGDSFLWYIYLLYHCMKWCSTTIIWFARRAD